MSRRDECNNHDRPPDPSPYPLSEIGYDGVHSGQVSYSNASASTPSQAEAKSSHSYIDSIDMDPYPSICQRREISWHPIRRDSSSSSLGHGDQNVHLQLLDNNMDADKKAPSVRSEPVADVEVGHHESRPVSPWTKFVSHIWDSDIHLKSPQERALVRKLDFGILICATLGWWIKYVDQSNLTNACTYLPSTRKCSRHTDYYRCLRHERRPQHPRK